MPRGEDAERLAPRGDLPSRGDAADVREVVLGEHGALAGAVPGSLVVEVASNDGYLLKHFVAAGVPALGIEPAANVAEAAVANGVPVAVFAALPSRLVGLLENDLMQALPLYALMGALLNRLPLADTLFRTGTAALAPIDSPWVGFGLAVVATMFAYDGWDGISLVAGEVREPGKTIPRATFLGMGLILLVYLTVNVGFFHAMPLVVVVPLISPFSFKARQLMVPVSGRRAT